MSSVELDPEDLTKALRLLHSRTPESSDELKRMLDTYCNKPVKDVSLFTWVLFRFLMKRVILETKGFSECHLGTQQFESRN